MAGRGSAGGHDCGVGLASLGRVFSGRVCAQGGRHSSTSCSWPERKEGVPEDLCVCVCETSKTSLPQSINIYTDNCHKSARLANK